MTKQWALGLKEYIKNETGMENSFIPFSLAGDGKKIKIKEDKTFGDENYDGLLGEKKLRERNEEQKEELREMLDLSENPSNLNEQFLLLEKLSNKMTVLNEAIITWNQKIKAYDAASKIVFVAKNKIVSLNNIRESLMDCIKQVISSSVSYRTNSSMLLPRNDTVEGNMQLNLRFLEKLTSEEETRNLTTIIKCPISLSDYSEIVLSRPNIRIRQDSKTYAALASQSKITSCEIFNACGLSKERPVLQLKELRKRYNKRALEQEAKNYNDEFHKIAASFAGYFASLTFGANRIIIEAGILFCGGYASTVDLMVCTKDQNVESVVRFAKVNDVSESYLATDEEILNILFDIYSHKVDKGYLVKYDENMMIIIEVTAENTLISTALQHITSFLEAERFNSRTPHFVETAKNILRKVQESDPIILGYFPLLKTFTPSKTSKFSDFLTATPSNTVNETLIMPKINNKSLEKVVSSVNESLRKLASELILFTLTDISGTGVYSGNDLKRPKM